MLETSLKQEHQVAFTCFWKKVKILKPNEAESVPLNQIPSPVHKIYKKTLNTWN